MNTTIFHKGRIQMATLVFILLVQFQFSSCTYKVAPPARASIASRSALLESKSTTDRMLVYESYLVIEVRNTDTANTQLVDIITKQGGMIERQYNSGAMLRVPADKLQETLTQIGALGRITQKQLSVSDITDAHNDVALRLENAQNARKRYLELLAKAENVEAALKVEKELERLNGEITQLENTIARNKKQVVYSSIQVNLQEKTKPGVLGYVLLGVYHGVKWLFVR